MGCDIHALRALFPFPSDFSPKIAELLDDRRHDLTVHNANPTGFQDDFGWILDDFWSSAHIPLANDDEYMAQLWD